MVMLGIVVGIGVVCAAVAWFARSVTDGVFDSVERASASQWRSRPLGGSGTHLISETEGSEPKRESDDA